MKGFLTVKDVKHINGILKEGSPFPGKRFSSSKVGELWSSLKVRNGLDSLSGFHATL